MMKVNFCVFNHHPRTGIVDHLWFIKALCAKEKVDLEISDDLRPDALNIILENFTENSASVIQSFCRTWGKSVGVVLTEHIEVENRGVKFNFGPLNDGGPPLNKRERFWSLCLLADRIFSFFAFGELPKLDAVRDIFPTSNLRTLPYPNINTPARERIPEYDIVFTGQVTDYRREVLATLSRRYRVIVVDISHALPDALHGIDSGEDRENAHAQAKVAINIPQSPNWRLGSPMRILYSLRRGLPIIHYGEPDETLLSRSVVGEASLEDAICDPVGVWRTQMGGYKRIIESPLNPRFPHGLFAMWQEAERATLQL